MKQERTKILNRLKRLEGQVRGLYKMVDEERPCQEVLTLLSGLRGALEGIGDLVLEEYLRECQAGFQNGQLNPKSLVEAVKLLR